MPKKHLGFIRRVVRRHPRYFLVLMTCVWLLFVSTMLVSSLYLSEQSQDTRQRASDGATTAADDMYFLANNDLEINKESDGTKIQLNEVKEGERYLIRNKVIVQNDLKNKKPDNRSVTLRFTANDSGSSTKIFAKRELNATASGLLFHFETTFVGKTDNVFRTVLDTENEVAETNENNNVLETTYKYEVTNKKTEAKDVSFAGFCNRNCANDSDCGGYGLKCWYNQCRHPDNVESSSCAPRDSSVPGCNIACNSARDCASGLTCYQGRCRDPQSAANDRCVVSQQSAGTGGRVPDDDEEPADPTTRPTVRPTTRPAATATSRPAARPGATARPATGSAANPPAATGAGALLPTPRPTATPPLIEDSFDDDIPTFLETLPGGAWLQSSLDSAASAFADGSWRQWLLWVIGGGLAVLALIILASLVRRRPSRSLPPVPPPINKPLPTAPVRPVSVRPGVSPTNGSAPIPVTPAQPISPATPAAVTHPSSVVPPQPVSRPVAQPSTPPALQPPTPRSVVQPVAQAVRPPSASTPQPSDHKPAQPAAPTQTITQKPTAVMGSTTMINRLQQRGVIKPAGSPPPGHT